MRFVSVCVCVCLSVCLCVCVSELLDNVDPTLGNAAVAAVLVELVSPLLLVLSGVCA